MVALSGRQYWGNASENTGGGISDPVPSNALQHVAPQTGRLSDPLDPGAVNHFLWGPFMRTAYSALACAVYLTQDLNEARKKKGAHKGEPLSM